MPSKSRSKGGDLSATNSPVIQSQPAAAPAKKATKKSRAAPSSPPSSSSSASVAPFIADGFQLSPSPVGNLMQEILTQTPDSASSVHVSPVSRRALYGGLLSRVPVSFSLDEKVFFLCSGSIIKIHSTNTGDALGALSGHDDTVTCTATTSGSKFLLWSGSLDGSVRCWDFYEQNCLFKLPCLGAVLHMHITQNGEFIYATVNSHYPQDPRACKIVSIEVKKYQSWRNTNNHKGDKDPENDENSGYQVLYKGRNCVGMAVNPSGTHLASISKRALTVYDLRTGDRVKHNNGSTLSSVAFHPQDDYLVTGDEQGRILLWHRYFDPRSPIVSKLHWHSGTVTALQFTSDGVYLLSGGLEAVLVIWQLETGHKQFIPRFQSAIASISISPEGDTYCISCTENVVNFVSSVSSKVTRSIYGIQYSASDSSSTSLSAIQSSVSDSPAPPLTLDPRTFSFVFPAHHATFLQFFDLHNEQQIMELNVTQRQLVQSGVKANSINANFVGGSSTTRVSRFALNSTGDLLVTVERRHDGQFKDKERLKIWLFNRQLQLFQLNTNVLSPHSAAVHSIHFHPSQPQFITLAHDNSFKVWQQIHKFFIPSANKQSQSAADKLYFICKYQLNYRDFPCLAASFSPDGSQLAASFGQIITIWNTGEEYSLHSILAQPNPTDPIRSLLWLAGPSPRLVSQTCSALYVWDTATRSVVWQHQACVAAIAADTRASPARFAAVFTHTRPRPDDHPTSLYSHVDKYIGLFSPDSPAPISVLAVPDLRLERIGDSTTYFSSQIAFRSSKSDGSASSTLVYWNRFKQLVEFPLDGSASGPAASPQLKSASGPLALPESQSLFDKLYGSKALRASVSTSPEVEFTPDSISFLGDAQAIYRKLFSGAVHVLPPATMLYKVFMDTVLKKRNVSVVDNAAAADLAEERNEEAQKTKETEPINQSTIIHGDSESSRAALKALEEELFKAQTAGDKLFKVDLSIYDPVLQALKGVQFSTDRRDYQIKAAGSKKRAANQAPAADSNGSDHVKENGVPAKSSKKSKAAAAEESESEGPAKKKKKTKESGDSKKSKK